jgi:D-beta-D-heptose 7-phosphate kinase/D-beta-D-heptose 1-phosphate adenosyltransferase|tara:strand:+ start:865 stop:1278 length:414 start_codon:yes stop_codon:yes gene_type:complete
MQNNKIWVNGCFDIMHLGHIRMLQYARGLGSHLKVGIDGDDRILKSKGSGRPINDQQSRTLFLMALSCVDDVVVFDSDQSLIDEIIIYSPSLIVVGSEYREIGHPAEDYVSGVAYFNKISGFSTTDILEKVKENGKK